MALHRAGCEVDAVCPKGHPLRKTRALHQEHAYYGLSPWRSFARAIAESQPDLIVSGDDLATRHLHRLYAAEKRQTNSSLCSLIERSFGDPESFPIVTARAAFMDLAGSEDVRVPATQVVHNLDELKALIARMGLPAALKADGTSGGLGVRIVQTMAEAEHAFEQLHAPPLLARAAKRALIDQDKSLVWPSLLRHRPVVNIQTFVAGREATSALFCWQGSVLASLHFEVVNKASSAGHATVLRLIENAEMQTAAEAMARRLRLSGLYGLDFMLESETGNAYLIEINPRATQVGHLSLGRGRDLPAALHAALCAQGSTSKVTVAATERVTENDTIALFPQEWIRDPQSPFLRSAYHDIPWEEPDLVQDCVSNRQKQSTWYQRKAAAPVASAVPLNARAKSSSAGFGRH
jgi:biotin carboxylase